MKALCTLFGFCVPLVIASQIWQQVGGAPNTFGAQVIHGDSVFNELYVGGWLPFLNNSSVWAFSGNQWRQLDSCAPSGHSVTGITGFQNHIYVGSTYHGYDCSTLMRWDGASWDTMQEHPELFVRDLRVIGDDLYVSGDISKIGSQEINHVARFDGSDFHPVAEGTLGGFQVVVTAVAMYQGHLYVGGSFYDPAYPELHCLVRVVDGRWEPVPGWKIPVSGGVADLLVYQDKLYVAGGFTKSQGALGDNIVAFDGQNWFELQGGLTHIASNMEVYGDQIFVSGYFGGTWDIPSHSIIKWDGYRWCDVGKAVFKINDTQLAYLNDFTVWNDTLYAIGNFNLISNDSILGVAKLLHPDTTVTCTDSTGLTLVWSSGEASTPRPKSLSVWPNPTSGLITIQHPGFSPAASYPVAVSNTLGQVVLRVPDWQMEPLDLSALSPGLFIISVGAGGAVWRAKVVLSH